MIIDCISDLHGYYPKLGGGDLLIVAGDLTARHTEEEFYDFANWMMQQDYEDRIVIAGNHDTWLMNDADSWDIDNWCDTGEFSYLLDSGTEYEYEQEYEEDHKFMGSIVYSVKRKIKIWGSPWTLKFEGMNPQCMAFTCDTEEELSKKWEMIPDDVDILVTHSPPYGFRDKNVHGQNCGSSSLKARIWSLFEPLKIHVFGHIHESYGIELEKCYELSADEFDQKFINASHVNEYYKPVNKPVRVIL